LKKDQHLRQPRWLQISFAVNPVANEALSRFLFDLGCTGIVTEDVGDTTLRAYFQVQDEGAEIVPTIRSFLRDLEAIFPGVTSPRMRLSDIEDQDWSARWRSFFRPVQVTPSLLVVPPWEQATAGNEMRVIRIDPGLAFGTGQHPTTQMCLESMEFLPLRGPWTMLDVGTGSGILALYAAMLGAARVLAIDTDRDALRSAGENADLNGMATQVEFSSQPLETLSGSFSLIMGNLVLGTILELLSHFQRALAPDGRLVLSGVMRGQVPELEERIVQSGLQTERVSYKMDWACLVARHHGNREP
jgi:ribosomal protein L11 methyltransferase